MAAAASHGQSLPEQTSSRVALAYAEAVVQSETNNVAMYHAG